MWRRWGAKPGSLCWWSSSLRFGAPGRLSARALAFVLLPALVLALAAPTPAAPEVPLLPEGYAGRVLKVGVIQEQAFAMRQPDGSWRGIAVDLWSEVARELGLQYTLVETDLPGILAGLRQGTLDVAATALTLTPEREETLDFSHSFFRSGLGIAVPYQSTNNWIAEIWRVMHSRPVILVAVMCLAMLAAGAVVWMVERRRNPAHFGGPLLKGLGSGLWWAAQTLSTVGYGDKAPQTVGGRVLGFLWMLVSLVLVAIFSAVVTSSLTISSLEGKVRGPQDLDSVRVGVVAYSAGDEYLGRRHLSWKRYSKLDKGLEELVRGNLDAFVFDMPTLRYESVHDYQFKIAVLPDLLVAENYALGLPDKSPLRDPINLALLRVLHGDAWRKILFTYLGQNPDA